MLRRSFFKKNKTLEWICELGFVLNDIQDQIEEDRTRSLQKELQELKALKTSQPFYMQLPGDFLCSYHD